MLNLLIDRRWMYNLKCASISNIIGVVEFLMVAEQHMIWTNEEVILCPCVDCKNKGGLPISDIHQDLMTRGFMSRYTCWNNHGKTVGEEQEDDVIGNDHFVEDDPFPLDDDGPFEENVEHMLEDGAGDEYKADDDRERQMFDRMHKDNETPLFTGSKQTKLQSVLSLLQLKASNG